MAERAKTALVLAGGGIMGAAYEIGCLSALSRLFAPGFSPCAFDLYIGISAGSVIATLMANRIEPEALFRAIVSEELNVFNWRRKDIYRFDAKESLAGMGDVLRNLYRIYRNYRQNPWGFSLHDLVHILQEQFPAGLFSLAPLQSYLCRSFRKEGIIDDFQLLERELYIPAYDLDRGQRIVFGDQDHRGMHICQAITASCAIPYFFQPYRIGDSHFIDGSTGRVTHLDIAIDRGARLIVVINPRVPMDNNMETSCLPSLSYGRCSSIAELGINYAWEQSRRIENKEKLNLALEHYRHNYPDVEILLIEPGRDESLLFFQSPMSNLARNLVMTYGYNLTLGLLRARFDSYRKSFEKVGIATTDTELSTAPPAEVVT
jgi:predicted acylesterase/phospholipase RssA